MLKLDIKKTPLKFEKNDLKSRTTENLFSTWYEKFILFLLPIAGALTTITDIADEVPVRFGIWCWTTTPITLPEVLIKNNKVIKWTKKICKFHRHLVLAHNV